MNRQTRAVLTSYEVSPAVVTGCHTENIFRLLLRVVTPVISGPYTVLKTREGMGMSEQVRERTPQVIAAEINSYKVSSGRIQLTCAVEIGRRLIEAKALLPHGEWGKWLEEYVEYSKATAENYMRVAREYGQAGGDSPEGEKAKSETFPILSYSQALTLLDVPEEERAEFIAELDIENMSVRQLQRAIKEREQARQEKEEAEQESRELQKALKGEKEKNSQLEKERDGLKLKAGELEKEKQGLKQEVAERKAENSRLKDKQLFKNNEKLRNQLTATQIKNATHKAAFKMEALERAFKEVVYELGLLVKIDKNVHGEYQKNLRKFLLKCLDEKVGD
ncbi:Membrane-bound metallopeptidase [Desulfitobacterium sp. LBE]|nr:Membrane-bound metallopeptidase [Desulfitobacterium sp. LBE]